MQEFRKCASEYSSDNQSPNNDLRVSLLTAVSRNTAAASAEIDTLRLYVSFRSVVAKKKKKVVIMKSVVLMNNLIKSPPGAFIQ